MSLLNEISKYEADMEDSAVSFHSRSLAYILNRHVNENRNFHIAFISISEYLCVETELVLG